MWVSPQMYIFMLCCATSSRFRSPAYLVTALECHWIFKPILSSCPVSIPEPPAQPPFFITCCRCNHHAPVHGTLVLGIVTGLSLLLIYYIQFISKFCFFCSKMFLESAQPSLFHSLLLTWTEPPSFTRPSERLPGVSASIFSHSEGTLQTSSCHSFAYCPSSIYLPRWK